LAENFPGSGRADLITCPITVMQGGKDVVVLPDEGKSIADYYGGRAEFVLFPEAGHSVITDDLPLFVSALRTSLK
jgi:pimeloyl-ACP methyl ester carboxylesterase